MRDLQVGCSAPARSARTFSDDVADLYRARADQLRQIVRFTVRAPDAVIDDACQIAWSRLLSRWGSIRSEAAMPWLARTASREAVKLMRRSTRDLSLDALGEDRCAPAQAPFAPPAPSPPDLTAEFRARFDELRALPQRQQRLLWLQGLGLSYVEMAGYTGWSTRTVERQLMRAKRSLRRAAG
jgi:RNA polymerase sigma factor (sigma-70 family)